MKIEIACKQGDTNKAKGDLLENISKDLLKAQGYEVIEEIRFTGVELDLLCKHKVNGKQIYVECKAQKDKIGAPILRQLLGTVTGYDYSEGWLISTSEFGKEAKGFSEMWKEKPSEISSKLSFYSPELIIESLQTASVICERPIKQAEIIAKSNEFLGDWVLLVTTYGRFWAVYTLQGGVPFGVLIFNAKNGRHIQEEDMLINLSQLNSNIAEYDLKVGIATNSNIAELTSKNLPKVVEVQIGDSWDDYRPARPQDFVGRDQTQKDILSFLKNVNQNKSNTRVFAITGNSGLGKSSLIAKLRERSRNKFYRNRFFIFAVDIRGATTPSYISAALLDCLKNAQNAGFGDRVDLQLTDPSSPLASLTISKYLQSVKRKGQVICLVFDQFEELYSKPELFGIFNAAKNLMLDVSAHKENFVLGFAWKTDSTTQQDHPAYHMWHDLADHRRVYKLEVFDNGEISKSITTFEKEIDQKIPIETRHQIINSSQGFPWLLKKLCINLYENIKKGDSSESLVIDFDVSRLFENDINLLTSEEFTCLKLIARNAPADWGETIEISGPAVINSLVNKRMIIKSGSRLNVYWDIFKDFLLTGAVPVVPFNYIPTSDFSSMLKVAFELDKDKFITSNDIAKSVSLNERTIWNIGADLVMLGIAERKGVMFRFHRELDGYTDASILDKFRVKLEKHSLKLSLYKNHSGKTLDIDGVAKVFKTCLPKAQFSDKTWKTYTNRLVKLLLTTGYLIRIGNNLVVQDTGSPIFDKKLLGKRTSRQRGVVFSAMASPASVCEALSLIDSGVNDTNILKEKGYRNSLIVLNRFELIKVEDNNITLNDQSIFKYGGHNESIWSSAKNEPTISRCIKKLELSPSITGVELGEFLSDAYSMNWTKGSKARNGNSLKQWSNWIKEGIELSIIPLPPGRSK